MRTEFGDADGVERLAVALGFLADEVDRIGGSGVLALDSAWWRGPAVDRLRGRAEMRGAQLRGQAAELRAAAGALNRHVSWIRREEYKARDGS
jgi:hypothetical protein